MKKLFALLLTLLLLLSALPAASAQTADYADVYLSIRPTANTAGQLMLEINIEVRNGASDQYISMMEFRYENDLIASVDRVYGGSTAYLWSNPLNMSLTGMTDDVELEVSYVDFHGGSVTSNTIVRAEEAAPQLDFKRSASRSAVASGETVTLTYILKNEGSVTLQNVEVYDDIPGVGVVGTADILFPGDMREFTKVITVTADIKSQPYVSFATQSNPALSTMMLDSMKIVVSNPKLNVTLKSDVAKVEAGESVTLVCNVLNEGNISFVNAQIYDETLGVIMENAQIEAGKAYSWNKLIKPMSSQNYMFTVRAVDADGQVYTAASNMVMVEVASAAAQEGAETLEVTVTPNTKELAQPGEITFNFLLRNTGAADATGVIISDREGNVLTTLDTLPPGDKMLPVAMRVEQSGDYYFTVDATLSGGMRVQRVTMPMSILVGQTAQSAEPFNTTLIETPAPTPTPVLVMNNDRVAGIAPWIIGLIILIVLLIVACVVVLVLLQLRAARRQEDEEDEVYIPPQTQPRRPAPPAPERDPYDYREEISRVATEYSRPVPPRSPQRTQPLPEEDEAETVYRARKPAEPTTKRG